MTYKHADLTKLIIAAFYEVHNNLGYGFLEKVYEKALAIELRKRGHGVEPRKPIRVFYAGTRSTIAQLSQGYTIRSRIVAQFWSQT